MVGEYVATGIAESQLYVLSDAKERHTVEERPRKIAAALDYTTARDASESKR